MKPVDKILGGAFVSIHLEGDWPSPERTRIVTFRCTKCYKKAQIEEGKIFSFENGEGPEKLNICPCGRQIW